MKRILAITLTFVLAMGLAVPAFASVTTPGSTIIDGYGNVVPVVLNVTVPTELAFTMDPFLLVDDELTSADFGMLHNNVFAIANASNVGVVVGIDFTLHDDGVDNMLTFAEGAAAGSGAADAGALNVDPSLTDNNLSMAVTVAQTITADAITFATATANNRVDFTTGNLEQVVAFALAAPDATTNNVAAFGLHANMNPFGTWAVGDVAISGVITIIPVNATTLTDVLDSVAATYAGHRRIEAADAPEAASVTLGFGGTGTPTDVAVRNANTAVVDTLNASGDIVIPFLSTPAPVVTGDPQNLFVMFGTTEIPVTLGGAAPNNTLTIAAANETLTALRTLPAGTAPISASVVFEGADDTVSIFNLQFVFR